MCNLICSKRGISLIECLIALLLLNIGVLALVSLQPAAWRLSGKSDFLGRAAGILKKELQINEVWIMNPNNPNPCAVDNPVVVSQSVYSSGQATPQPGDASFTVVSTTQDLGNGRWLVSVTVTPPDASAPISESLVVTRQELFTQ